MQIPYKELREDVLRSIIEEFVLREGTEYGSLDHSLEEKVADVRTQLEKGKVEIVFDPKEESCDIVVVKRDNG